MKATVYLPGQPARLLTAAEVAALDTRLIASAHTENEEMLSGNWEVAARVMGVAACDLLLATPTACAFGLENAEDFNCYALAGVDAHLTRLFDYSGFVGPMLIVEE